MKKSCSGPTYLRVHVRMFLCQSCLVAPQLLQKPSMCHPTLTLQSSFPLPLRRNSPYKNEFKSVFSTKCKLRDLFETFPYLSHTGVLLLNYCSIYCLSAPDWRVEKKLLLWCQALCKVMFNLHDLPVG